MGEELSRMILYVVWWSRVLCCCFVCFVKLWDQYVTANANQSREKTTWLWCVDARAEHGWWNKDKSEKKSENWGGGRQLFSNLLRILWATLRGTRVLCEIRRRHQLSYKTKVVRNIRCVSQWIQSYIEPPNEMLGSRYSKGKIFITCLVPGDNILFF